MLTGDSMFHSLPIRALHCIKKSPDGSQPRQRRLSKRHILRLAPPGNTNRPHQHALVLDRQAAAEADEALALHQAVAEHFRAFGQAGVPFGGGGAEADHGVGLVERDVDGVERRPRVALEDQRVAGAVDDGDADLDAGFAGGGERAVGELLGAAQAERGDHFNVHDFLHVLPKPAPSGAGAGSAGIIRKP